MKELFKGVFYGLVLFVLLFIIVNLFIGNQPELLTPYPGQHKENDVFLFPVNGDDKATIDDGRRAEKVIMSYKQSPFHYSAYPEESILVTCPEGQFVQYRLWSSKGEMATDEFDLNEATISCAPVPEIDKSQMRAEEDYADEEKV